MGAAVVAAITSSVCVGLLHGGWHPLGEGATAVGIGMVGGVLSGLLAQMLAARGSTTEQLVDGGAGVSLLALGGGFVVLLVIALVTLPRGIHSDGIDDGPS